MIVAKWGVSAFTGPAVGLSWRESNALGVLMNCRGLEILIVGLIGLQAGVLTEQMMAVFVLGAIVTTLMTGPLFDRFAPRVPDAEAVSAR
jgi:Kef-type K+ transport system membrane component KefB